MTLTRCDILISGGGLAGLAAAACFGTAGFSVICVDPEGPAPSASSPGADLRTTAILAPGAATLARAGVWDRLAPHAAPLATMRIVDAGRGDTPKTRDFSADEVTDGPFGWNLPNWRLRNEIAAHLATLPGVSFRTGQATARVLTRLTEARVTLSDGATVSARLLIAADGRDSPVRRALGIPVTTLRYGQAALAFAVTHKVPHAGVSTEIHRSGGPFTLVPLPDRDGQPASSVVWMERAPEAARLAALPDAAFAAEASARSGHVLGPLALASPRQAWPIVSQIAARMAGERTALMAEAAHVLPPIGAQGLNTSLADLACLLDLAVADPAALGTAPMLDAYHRKRHPQVLARIMGVDALNRASMAGAPVLQALRAAALGLIHDAAPVRRALMRTGMGAR